jgi:hypothetical protein
MELIELRRVNSGYEPFPAFIRRQRIPRDGSSPLMMTDNSFEEYKPEDLQLGKTVTILGKDFLLYDLDEFTKTYYKTKFNITDFTPISVYGGEEKKMVKEIPPYLGFGTELDELSTCFHVKPFYIIIIIIIIIYEFMVYFTSSIGVVVLGQWIFSKN